MKNNFHLFGFIITVILTVLIYLVFSNFVELNILTYLSAAILAFSIMVLSKLFRDWGAKGDNAQVLKGISLSLGSKVAILLIASWILNQYTNINIRYFLIILVAIYFFLFIFEVLHMMKMENRNIKKT